MNAFDLCYCESASVEVVFKKKYYEKVYSNKN